MGKTALLYRLCNNSVPPQVSPTIAPDFFSLKVARPGKETLKLQLWDTAGQEMFNSLAAPTFHHARGAILVYDITSRKSFERLGFWLEQLESKCGSDLPMIVVGNKLDREAEREVPSQELIVFAKERKFVFVKELSVMSEDGEVAKTVQKLVDAAVERVNESAAKEAKAPEESEVEEGMLGKKGRDMLMESFKVTSDKLMSKSALAKENTRSGDCCS